MHERWTCNKSADKRLEVWGRGEVLKSCGSVLPTHHIFVSDLPGLHETRWGTDELPTVNTLFVIIIFPFQGCLLCDSALYVAPSMFLPHNYVQRLHQTIQFSFRRKCNYLHQIILR